MRDLSRLGDKLNKLKEYFATEPSLEGVYLFGSFGTPEENALSDIDFGLIFNQAGKKQELWDLMALEAVLSRILERDDVDVVNLNTAPVSIRFAAITTGELIFVRDPYKVADFREQTIDYYLDYKPILDKMQRDFMASWQEGGADDTR